MSHPGLALQAAIKSALSDGSPTPVPHPVHDDVPQDTAPPYVQIGDVTGIDAGDKTRVGMETTVTLAVVSAYEGYKELKEILGQIYDALHEQSLSVSGQDLVYARFEFETTFPEPDGERRRGIQRYRIITRSQT